MVTIVIPAFNEEKYLADCLKSLTNQNTKLKYEIIVVDNNSTDATGKIAESFKDRLNLKVVFEKKQGRGAARARGFKESLGEVILSADADTIYYPDWIDTLVENLNDQTVASITSCKITDCTLLTNAVFNFLQPKFTALFRLIFGHFWLPGFSFAIKKSEYKKTKGFNHKLQALEDVDLSFKVAKLGKIKFINKPVIFSGRRFKGNLIMGIYEYIHTFIQAFIIKKQAAYMDNIR